MAKTWSVLIPIAGHARVEVEADTEEAAQEAAFDKVTRDDIEEEWETLTTFIQGNVCYCPSPWDIEVILIDDGEAA